LRKQFTKTIEYLMARDDRLVVLLGDIGVFGFRDVFRLYPERIYNIGVCEQATIGVAAGLAKEGFIPVVHSIAPFIVERCFEQLKIDLCYQGLATNVVSVGGSYDYAALGSTHHCPGDIAALLALPNMNIIVPGTAREFDVLFRAVYDKGIPTYFRLSELCHDAVVDVNFGRAEVIKVGCQAVVIVVGHLLSAVVEATNDLDVTVLYYSTVVPFDGSTLRQHSDSGKVVLIEPFYSALSNMVMSAVNRSVILYKIGVPFRFLKNYGSVAEHNTFYGLTSKGVRARLEAIL